jgi:hypothetical protein
MDVIRIESDNLKKMMRETFIDVLTQRRDLIEEAVIEAMEDIGLGIAMEEGRTGEYADTRLFTKKLNERIKKTK